MNVLIIGSGKGSWEMRGIQLGTAIGARVTSAPSEADWQWADRVVLIKRAGPIHANEARQRGLPVVWDALDFWKQPADNGLTEAEAMRLLEGAIRLVRPALVIGATQAMTKAIRELGYAAEYLPHHSWQGLVPTPPREQVQIVAYEGNPVYLGSWLAILQNECAKRGWTFVVNPKSLSEADILVALRNGIWDGWMCREWKSGVKVVNAMAAARPMIAQGSAAMREILCEERRCETIVDVTELLDVWSHAWVRQIIVNKCGEISRQYTLEAVAALYRDMLARVEAPCSAI